MIPQWTWAKVPLYWLANPRLLRAEREGHKGLDLYPWLLLFAQKADDGGRLTVGGLSAEPEDIAAQIPGNPRARASACLDSALAIGLLAKDSDGALAVVP